MSVTARRLGSRPDGWEACPSAEHIVQMVRSFIITLHFLVPSVGWLCALVPGELDFQTAHSD